MLELNFSGKIALVTGATRGIGRTTACLMAKEGATLIVTGTTERSLNALKTYMLENDIPGTHDFMVVDFSVNESTNKFLSKLSSYERIDICINNAGINIIKNLGTVTDNEYDKLMDVNLKAPYKVSRVVAELMRQSGYGRIVNVSSIWGVITKAKRSLYTSSKHGLIGMSKTIAVEYGASNVLVNSLSPGFTLTELTRNSLSDEEIQQLAEQIPINRMAEPEEIAKAILFLVSDLNSYITGQNIIIDGGFTII